MPLATAQVQVRDLVMGPGTLYTLDQEVNPFTLTVRADQGGPRAWGHGTWSGAEWANERVVPIRLTLTAADMPSWVSSFQQLAAAFAPVADGTEQVTLRFEIGGNEYVIFGRPRMIEPTTTLLGSFSSQVRLSFVAQDPRIYAGTESTTGAVALPSQAGGLLVPSVVSSTPPWGLVIDGTAGEHASTPDAAALDVTGDIDLLCDATLDTWGASADNQTLIAKYAPTGDQRSYWLMITSAGELRIQWSTDGTSGGILTRTATASPPVVDGERLAVWAHLDVDDGAGNHEATFWTAPTMAGPWTQLGSVVSASGTTSIHAGTAAAGIGAFVDGGSDAARAAGVVHAAQIRDAGTTVAFPRFDIQAAGATSFADRALTWTVGGTASVSGRVAGGGLLVPFTIDSTLVGGRALVVNAGTTNTALRLRVDGPVPEPRVILQRPDGTVQSIEFVPGFDLPAGQWIDIDTSARTALLNGLPQSSVRGQAAWLMDPFPLPPGESTLRFGADDVTAGTLTATWRSAWW